MFRRIVAPWLVIALALGVAVPALAQGGGGRVEDELRRTDEGLARAEQIVRESGSERARSLLEGAFRLQENAWGQFRNHGSQGLTRAAHLTAEARQVGARAVTIARHDQSLEERARREAERADRALARAFELAGDQQSPQVQHLLREAKSLLERARVEYQEQHFEAALRLAVSSQRLIRQAGDLSGASGDVPRLLRELERTDNLIERVEQLVRENGDAGAQRMLERGIALQQSAWMAYREQKHRFALAQTREARGLVNRARSQVLGPVDGDSVRKAIGETEALLDRAADVIRDSGDERARAVLDRALGHQTRARRLHQDAQYRQALAETRVARTLAQRALRMVQEEGLAR